MSARRFPTSDRWEDRQRVYRAREDREAAEHAAKYPQHYMAEEKPEPEASTIRTFYRRVRR